MRGCQQVYGLSTIPALGIGVSISVALASFLPQSSFLLDNNDNARSSAQINRQFDGLLCCIDDVALYFACILRCGVQIESQ